MVDKTRVKICGITNLKDALKACSLGAWALGFVFYKKSPRYITPLQAKNVIRKLPPFISPVAVFVNERKEAIHSICQLTRIQTMQLHGDESPFFCKNFKDYKIIKAFRIKDCIDQKKIIKFKVSAYLFDTFQENIYGGSGKEFSWGIFNNFKLNKPFILAGGLSPRNIQKAIEIIHPYAVDVSSSLEKLPGIKDHRLMEEFFEKLEVLR